jgi:hypothetical protein
MLFTRADSLHFGSAFPLETIVGGEAALLNDDVMEHFRLRCYFIGHIMTRLRLTTIHFRSHPYFIDGEDSVQCLTSV